MKTLIAAALVVATASAADAQRAIYSDDNPPPMKPAFCGSYRLVDPTGDPAYPLKARDDQKYLDGNPQPWDLFNREDGRRLLTECPVTTSSSSWAAVGLTPPWADN